MPAKEIKNHNSAVIAKARAAQELSSVVEKRYNDLELHIGQAYIDAYERRFGVDSFPQSKRKYMLSPRAILLEVGEAYGIFQAHINNTAYEYISEVRLNNKVITGYRVPSEKMQNDIHQDGETSDATKSAYLRSSGRLIPQGRIPVVTLMPLEAVSFVSPEVIPSSSIPWGEEAEGISAIEQIIMIRNHLSSKNFASILSHEKSHGMQRQLPLQIGEIWAYYMERFVMKEMFDIEPNIGVFSQAVDFFDTLVLKYGNDPLWGGKYGKDVLLRLMMGELGSVYRRADRDAATKLMDLLKQEFTPEILDSLFPTVEWIEDKRFSK